MNFIKRIGKLAASFIGAGSMLLNGCNSYQPPTPNPNTEVIDAFPVSKKEAMQKELTNKKLALAIITNNDDNNATEGIEEMFMADFSDLPNYQLYTARADNLEEFFNNLRDYSAIKPIDALILAYHGSQNGIEINFGKSINIFNAKKLFQNYSSVFSNDAIILLYSCSSGKGDRNIATSLAEVLDRDVVAPKFTLIPETGLKQNERVGEFAPDETGRASFDYNNFRTYEKIDFKGRRYLGPLATFSYENAKG
ncbi:hypothetical protein HY643_04215 [Candidatus Woesearchaeota archaeon]|nr:hypothetical protein [Candidatus Woesearchaeota archaeon]